MSYSLDDSQCSDCPQLIYPSNDPIDVPTPIQFQCDKRADAMTTCSDAFIISPLTRYFTTNSAPDDSPQHILYQCPPPESFCRYTSLPSTPLRPSAVSPPPCFQQLSRVYSAPYTASWVEQQLSSSPSPLSKVPPVPGCALSPPIHKAEGTPFDLHFNLSQSWNSSTPDMSPIARRTSDGNATYSPRKGGNSCRRFSEGSCLATPWLLMDKLPSLNPSKSHVFSPGRISNLVTHASGLSWSPVSSLSALTPLSSPECSISDNVPSDSWSRAPTPIAGWNPTTDRYSKDNHELSPASRGSLRTTRHLVSVRSRKRPLPKDHNDELFSCRMKRARTVDLHAVGLTSQPLETHSGIPSQRCLPPEVSRHPEFPLFYRRYPVSSFLQLDDQE
ncbi:hypothetical protein K503DRAFT_451198 [Rhizopogon vinicolor AM-OR11-026]|uniref:Uncharacterized protein n=1 Tax=Rhizopogon vinicolor AM-OR11-026 TaxID=1314800 RepID=A0A1B7NA81_9AGAM|nr:hypothetical protein K503DRAFT_451198 [Rhizopogon vinicolor AM-OR11-026]